MIYELDLHTFFSRFQKQSNEKFSSASLLSPHVRSRFELHEVLGNTKIGTYSHQLWQSGFHACSQNSNFTQLHALSEVPGTPKMVIRDINYGKAGCDREITSRLGGIDRDNTTLFSSHSDWPLPWQQSRDTSEVCFAAYVCPRRPAGLHGD